MNALIVYESMYGNTREVAEAIADGIGGATVVPVGAATGDLVANADLLIVGGPTHAHGMSRPSTRTSAEQATEKAGNQLRLEPGATGIGVREWLDTLPALDVRAAAFDTRIKGPGWVMGRASKGISKRLRDHGATLVCPRESFFVTKENELRDAELERARDWGSDLASRVLVR